MRFYAGVAEMPIHDGLRLRSNGSFLGIRHRPLSRGARPLFCCSCSFFVFVNVIVWVLGSVSVSVHARWSDPDNVRGFRGSVFLDCFRYEFVFEQKILDSIILKFIYPEFGKQLGQKKFFVGFLVGRSFVVHPFQHGEFVCIQNDIHISLMTGAVVIVRVPLFSVSDEQPTPRNSTQASGWRKRSCFPLAGIFRTRRGYHRQYLAKERRTRPGVER